MFSNLANNIVTVFDEHSSAHSDVKLEATIINEQKAIFYLKHKSYTKSCMEMYLNGEEITLMLHFQPRILRFRASDSECYWSLAHTIYVILLRSYLDLERETATRCSPVSSGD